jgi:hypothetical protein
MVGSPSSEFASCMDQPRFRRLLGSVGTSGGASGAEDAFRSVDVLVMAGMVPEVPEVPYPGVIDEVWDIVDPRACSKDSLWLSFLFNDDMVGCRSECRRRYLFYAPVNDLNGILISKKWEELETRTSVMVMM